LESTRKQAEAQLGTAHDNAWKKQLGIEIVDGVTPTQQEYTFQNIYKQTSSVNRNINY
jgi:hypothetical protein